MEQQKRDRGLDHGNSGTGARSIPGMVCARAKRYVKSIRTDIGQWPGTGGGSVRTGRTYRHPKLIFHQHHFGKCAALVDIKQQFTIFGVFCIPGVGSACSCSRQSQS